jgi:hypothetical protein
MDDTSFGEEQCKIAKDYPIWLEKEKKQFAEGIAQMIKQAVDDGKIIESASLKGETSCKYDINYPEHLETYDCQKSICKKVRKIYRSFSGIKLGTPLKKGMWSAYGWYRGISVWGKNGEYRGTYCLVLSWDGYYI